MNTLFPVVKPEIAFEYMESDKTIHLVDVRTDAEYASGHAQGAYSMPMEKLDATNLARDLGASAGYENPLYLICTAGFRAEQAARKLKAEGLHKLIVVEGGTNAWAKRKLPMRQFSAGSRFFPASPQAQAQLFMGLLILLFAIKSILLHPLFMGMAGLLGIVLAVSAVCERYSLARLFAEMPWNQTSSSAIN